jgi:uncharacterized membrane protein
MSQTRAIGLSLALLIGSWAAYDMLWRSPLGKRPGLAAGVSVLALVALAWGLTHVFNGQAAFLHMGAILGTLMVSNVWQHILPSQRELVRLTEAGKRQEAALGKAAKTRSIHNNYMTFPVLFTMISGHFPSTYGGPHAWLVLVVVMLTGAGVRHVMNIRFTWPAWRPALAAILVTGFGLVWALTRPAPLGPEGRPVAWAEVAPVLQRHCVSCHAARPGLPPPPKGVALDTREGAQRAGDRILMQAVHARAMPPGNLTGMTDEERRLLGRWLQGSRQ